MTYSSILDGRTMPPDDFQAVLVWLRLHNIDPNLVPLLSTVQYDEATREIIVECWRRTGGADLIRVRRRLVAPVPFAVTGGRTWGGVVDPRSAVDIAIDNALAAAGAAMSYPGQRTMHGRDQLPVVAA